MSALIVVVAVLVLATIYGALDRKRSGSIKSKDDSINQITPHDIGSELGKSATVLQFSSAFCSPCRTTRSILTSVMEHFPNMKHVEVDAEKNLELVRRLKIYQTPTTLFLNASGKEIARAVGAPKRDQVISALQNI